MKSTTSIKKAYFTQQSNGQRLLKVWYLGRVDIIDIDCKTTVSRSRILYKDVIDYCLAVGFQDDTYPIDNRTDVELQKDYQEAIKRAYDYEITPPGSFEAWKETQVLSF